MSSIQNLHLNLSDTFKQILFLAVSGGEADFIPYELLHSFRIYFTFLIYLRITIGSHT